MLLPSDSYVEFRDLLSRLGAEPVGIGALAALRYRSEPRATTDVDFLVRSLTGVAEAARQLGLSARVLADDRGVPYLVFIRGDGVPEDVIIDRSGRANRPSVRLSARPGLGSTGRWTTAPISAGRR